MLTGIKVREIIPSKDPIIYKKQAYRLVKTLVGAIEVRECSKLPPINIYHEASAHRVKKLMRILSEKFPNIKIEEAIKEVKESLKPVKKPGLFSKLLTGLKSLLKLKTDQ